LPWPTWSRSPVNPHRVSNTTVVTALEHGAALDCTVPADEFLATQKIGAGSRLGTVDALLSGTDEYGSSHCEPLQAFVHDDTLGRMEMELNSNRYRTHEFGDSIFVEKASNPAANFSSRFAAEAESGFFRQSPGGITVAPACWAARNVPR
jgi:hypothetical protein